MSSFNLGHWFPGYGARGRWTALISPINTRTMKLFLMKNSHATDAQAVVRKNEKGESVVEAVKTYAVHLQLEEVNEGELAAEPTVSGVYGESSDVIDFLQCVMDCGYKLGLRPSQEKDLSLELEATRNHLEDMRRIVLDNRGAGVQPLKHSS